MEEKDDNNEEMPEGEFEEIKREEPVKEVDNSNEIDVDIESKKVDMTDVDNKPLLGIDSVKTEYNEKPDALFDHKKHDNSDIKKIQEGQMKWAMFLMMAILIIVVIVPFVKYNYVDKFDYHGLTFQKTQLGDLEFYSTQFPVVVGTGEVVGSYSVNLRNNPKELDKIPITTNKNRIEFTLNDGKFGDAYIALNPFMELCDNSSIAMASLSGFLKDSNLNVISAVTDKAYARDNNITQRWCNSDPLDTVFYVTDGNDTKITEIQNGCYELQFNNCEILQVSERTILKMLEQYGENFRVE
jgi:hypothetical protein